LPPTPAPPWLDRVGLERLIGVNNLIDIDARFLTLGAAVARSVARIVVKDASGVILEYGTGFLVAPRLLRTNHPSCTPPSTWSAASSTRPASTAPHQRPAAPISAAAHRPAPDRAGCTAWPAGLHGRPRGAGPGPAGWSEAGEQYLALERPYLSG
jgi:hypothetical protein